MMNIPFASTVVCVNENLKTYLKPWESNNPYFWYFVCAGTAGGAASMLTTPLDVVKTRLQTQEVVPSCPRLQEMWQKERERVMKQQLGQNQQNFECCDKHATRSKDCGFEIKHTRYVDIKHTAQYIYKNEGLMAFTKGVLPRMSISAPSTALSWGTYELIKSMLISDD